MTHQILTYDPTVTVELQPATPDSTMTRRQMMDVGNEAILQALPTNEAQAIGKNDLFSKLTEQNKRLVDHNWNLRIAYLEERGDVLSTGRKMGKKYWANGNTETSQLVSE